MCLFHLSQNSNFWRIFQILCLPYWKTTSSKNIPQVYIFWIFLRSLIWQNLVTKMSLKISFLTQFWSFLNTTIKTVAYMMHHLACHTGQQFKQNWQILGRFGQKTTQKQPEMTVSTGTKTFENLKLKNYRSNIAKTCLLCVPP